MKILITDDEAFLREDLADALERVSPGNETDFAEGYETAVKKIKAGHYDIAFCDVQMPGKNGLELAETIKRISPSTNIIMVTAYSDYALDALRLFVSGYILKPVKDTDLAAALDNLRIAIPSSSKKLEVRCFGNFEVFADGKPMYFQRQKSREVLAYLICLRGASATRSEICDNIFEAADLSNERMISNFKVILHALKKDLKKIGLEDLLLHSQNRYSINPDLISCDYFDYITGRSTAKASYHGLFMTQYSWAEQFIYSLDKISAATGPD